MVSETVYDKNQAGFQSMQQTTSQGTSPQGTSPSGLGGLQSSPLNLPEGIPNPLSLSPLTGGGPAALKAAGTLMQAQLSNRAVGIISGSAMLGTIFASMMVIPNNIIGKAVNQWASSMNIDLGNLRLASFEQMYTIPIEDPLTGEWTYLFSDDTELEKRMADAGIPDDLIKNRVIQLRQQRDANAQIIQKVGSLKELRAWGKMQTGELPFTAAQRIVKEQTGIEQSHAVQAEIDVAYRKDLMRRGIIPGHDQELFIRQNPGDYEQFTSANSQRIQQEMAVRTPQSEFERLKADYEKNPVEFTSKAAPKPGESYKQEPVVLPEPKVDIPLNIFGNPTAEYQQQQSEAGKQISKVVNGKTYMWDVMTKSWKEMF